MVTYTYQQVRDASIEYFKGDELAAEVFAGKYPLKDNKGNFYEKTPNDMHKRLASEFARIELNYPHPIPYDEIYDMFSTWDVVAQGSPMSAIGNTFQFQSLSNCFVIESPYDSYGGIMKTDQEQAQIMKRRGGVGFDISTIRPKGMITANAARTTDGIGVFMERFSNTCREVAQGGRRGALMLTISCFEASTLILTEEGWKRVDDIVNHQYDGKVWTHEGFKEIEAYQKFENRDVYEVECENDKKITVTADHEFVVKNIETYEEYLIAALLVDREKEEFVFYDVISEIDVVKTTSKIRKITKAGNQIVYDFTVKDTHRILANGFYTSNCHHPEIRTFVNIKKDKKKVTGANISIRLSDEFMNAVKNNEKVQLRFPVEKSDNGYIIEEWVDARDLWHEIIEAAWESAEPGLLFWDTVKLRSPADAYHEFGYGSTSTNPCLTGETLIAVADGRGYVSIKQLADEGKDVPVYVYQNDTGKIIVKKMRNPRLTGNNIPVFRVTIEGGHVFKATGNHMMIMRDGSHKRVDELNAGDQLMISKRVERTLVELGTTLRSNNKNHYVMIENQNGICSEHRLIWQYYNGPVPLGHVIHHCNFNSRDNNIENLRCMTYSDHKELHASLMRGENNPIFKIKADPKRFAEYSAKMSESVSGDKNPRVYDVSNDEIREHVLLLTEKLGRRSSIREWYSYAKALNLPMSFTGSQRHELGSFYDLSIWAAEKLGFKHVSLDQRLHNSMMNAISQGYDCDVVDNEVYVSRTCEWCKEVFTNPLNKREIAFCSHSCSNFYANRKAGKNEVRKASLQAMHMKKTQESRKKQLDAFTSLRFSLGRDPSSNEWASECQKNKVPCRLGTKNGFTSWVSLKEEATLHNHRVVSVESCGNEDVYNGTVDDEHNYCFGGWDIGNNEKLQIHSRNCGEITLSPYDSCRLLLVNLAKFVVNPFTDKSYFDFARFSEVTRKAQKLMDDLVDLELEAVHRIIEKINNDFEPMSVKQLELDLWKNIEKAAVNGRRTGLGITALGDTLAYLGIKYGSDQSVDMTEQIYKTLALSAYRSSVEMARDRGTFPVFSHDIEKGHPFIEQIMDADDSLRELYKLYGRRNIALTTTAPAGSVSILTQTTSGCEPVFKTHYKRSKKITNDDVNSRVDRVDELGDKWQEYVVYHHGVSKWMNITGETDISKSPYAGATGEDIDWVKKIDVQAAAQKWIDHSISNCVVGRSLVETNKGLLYIDEIVEQQTKPQSHTEVDLKVINHHMDLVPAQSFFNNGIAPVLTIDLQNGLQITCTYNERIMVQRNNKFNWVYANNLQKGDKVALRTFHKYNY